MSDDAGKTPPGRGRDGNETTQVIELDERARKVLADRRDRGMLTLLTGAAPGTVHVLENAVNVMGRSQDADIQLDDAGLSRRHAQITRDDSGFHIEDLGSTNGTFVNGERVEVPRPLYDGDRLQIGQASVLRFSLHDALEHQAAKRMYESTVRDPLTQLHNRRFLDERLQGEFSYATRHTTRLSVMVLDVDYFKRVNDTLGHQAGDAVLQSIAHALATAVRAEDLVARYGGEEFVIVARSIDEVGALAFAERIRRIVEGLSIPWEPEPLRVTVSIGVAQLTTSRAYPSPDALVAAADGALYEAKRAGRNRVVVAT